MSIQLEYQHGTDVGVLRGCPNPYAADLLAIGGDHSVEVLQIGEDSCSVLASFNIGTRVTALAWSPRSTSPSQVDAWFLELVAAGEDLNLRLLAKTPDDASESVFVFGGGLSGHRRRVNDLTWCGGFGEDSYRYLASVSDDKILLFWDLLPASEGDMLSPSPSPAAPSRALSPSSRPQPVAFAAPYAHPLHSVASHPSTSKELVVSDAQGSVFVVDWRVDPADEDPEERYRGLSIAQLVDPRALADARTGMPTVWGGSVAWQQQDLNIVGAAYGSRWSIWDMRKLQGGKPVATGQGFMHGTHRFRWCPTSPNLFALSPLSPLDDATIHIHNTAYTQSGPRALALRPRPHRIRDFDWIGADGSAASASALSGRAGGAYPRLAAAVGRTVLVVVVGPDEAGA
ncbi:WD40-repeat-containing domain protein [Gautieria morchelliformis]|nr:WD40-repeat-containing domain protein [Gautieria morchelliformis]